MADLFSTDVLTTVVASLLGNPSFLLDRYFPSTQTETVEEIHFDVMDGKRRISPFVSPLVEGQIVADQGFKTSTYKPAYIKDKRVFDMNKPLKRSPGEQIGGTLSPMDRLRAMLAMSLQDQLNMIRRRMEVMAGQVLSTGKLVISGEKYATAIARLRTQPGERAGRGEVVERSLGARAERPRKLVAHGVAVDRRDAARRADDGRRVERVQHRAAG